MCSHHKSTFLLYHGNNHKPANKNLNRIPSNEHSATFHITEQYKQKQNFYVQVILQCELGSRVII